MRQAVPEFLSVCELLQQQPRCFKVIIYIGRHAGGNYITCVCQSIMPAKSRNKYDLSCSKNSCTPLQQQPKRSNKVIILCWQPQKIVVFSGYFSTMIYISKHTGGNYITRVCQSIMGGTTASAVITNHAMSLGS